MRTRRLQIATALSWYYYGYSFVAAQETTSTSELSTFMIPHGPKTVTKLTETLPAMVDPADRTYPTTVTTTYSTTRTSAATVTVDHVTVIDPWPISPDPMSLPYTMFQTEITQRIISPAAATPTTSSMTTNSTWLLWVIQNFDLPPAIPPECPGPGGCAPRSVKPHPLCEYSGRETRCPAQCQLKDWMWWCKKQVQGEQDTPMGRVCAGNNSTAYEQLLEPCDHTDFKPGCQLCPDTEEEGEQ
jgi:hypothetical protein